MEVSLDGPFHEGTRGSLKPRTGPRTTFTITEVTPGRSFTDVSTLPFATLTFRHDISPSAEGTSFTHAISITGPLAWLFGPLIGRALAADVPDAMRALAVLAAGDEGA